MLNQSKEEKEFFEKQKKPIGDKKRFMSEDELVFIGLNYIEKLTDRELQEKQVFYLYEIYRTNKSIKNNVQFWFYLTIASLILGSLVLING